MELRQLEYFVAVAEERSFTSAARRERVAQPAVSAQIRRLERQVGQPLFERSSREVRITQAGMALLPHARAALAAVRAGQAAVDEVADLVRGSVAIGTVTLHPVDIAALMAAFHADHPNVEITLRTDNSDVLLEKLADGTPRRRHRVHRPRRAPTRPRCGGHHRRGDRCGRGSLRTGLARRRTLTLEALCEHPLISLPVGTGLRSRLDSACAAAGLQPRIAFEATSPLELVDLARHGLGAAILPRSMARHDDLHPLRITPELRGRLVWAWRADATSPAARLFCARARREIRPASAAGRG